jgi:hypothetical protein
LSQISIGKKSSGIENELKFKIKMQDFGLDFIFLENQVVKAIDLKCLKKIDI